MSRAYVLKGGSERQYLTCIMFLGVFCPRLMHSNWKVVVQKEPRSMRVVADFEETMLPREARDEEAGEGVDTQASTQGTRNDDDYPNVPAHEVQHILDRICCDEAERAMANVPEYWSDGSKIEEDI
jgi:hypothetical protein